MVLENQRVLLAQDCRNLLPVRDFPFGPEVPLVRCLQLVPVVLNCLADPQILVDRETLIDPLVQQDLALLVDQADPLVQVDLKIQMILLLPGFR